MKNIYCAVVNLNDVVRFEKMLNAYRVGLNDWDKSKVFTTNNSQVVTYTILCEEETFVSLMDAMKLQ